MEKNGLKLITLDSRTEKFDKIKGREMETIISENFKERALVVAWLDYQVLIGTWRDNQFYFVNGEKVNNDYIQRLRVFDLNKELLVWRASGILRGRLRLDDLAGTGKEAVVAEQVLFGTRIGDACSGEYTMITEDRGTTLILPFTGFKTDAKRNLINRAFIKTYHYVGYNEIGQATYTDTRFVCFGDAKSDFT